MALRQHDHASAGQVQTHQMDELTRPYFIHHRNQVGINKALMDLFSLIDQFLQSDPQAAREHLMALRGLSDFVQQKQLVARMPSHGNPVDYYPEESGVEYGTRRNSMNVMTDLLRVVQGLQIPNSVPPSQPPPSQMQFPSYHNQPIQFPHTPPPSAPVTATSHSHAASEPTAVHSRTVSKEKETVTSDDSSSIAVSCMQGAADKLRAWLAKPETAALKKLISSKRSRKQSTSAPPRPSRNEASVNEPRSRQTQDFAYYGPIAHTNAPNTPTNPPHGTFPRTRSSSISYVDAQAVPKPWMNPPNPGGVWVTTETASKRDSLPPARKRRLSVAHVKEPATDERDVEKSNVPEKSKRTSGHSTDHEPSTPAKIKKKRPTSISFASLPVSERDREPGTHPPSAYSPLSTMSGVRNTISSDGSILDAPILHAKRDTFVHAAAYTTSPESQTKNVLVPQDRHERRGSSAIDALHKAYEEGAKRERNLPPLPDESSSSQSPDGSNQNRRPIVPNITVQPPSSAGTLTPQVTRSPMPSRSVAPAPNHLGIPISTAARTYVPTARNAVQGSSTPRASQNLSAPRLPLPPPCERSHTVSSDQSTSTLRPVSLYVHAPTSNAPVIRSASAGLHAPSQTSRETRMGPAVVKIYEDARPSVVRQGSTGSGHRKPAPPLTPPSSANHSRSHEDEGHSSAAEHRPLSTLRNPVMNQQPGTSPYPSPKSNDGAMSTQPGAEATIHQVSLAPTSTTQYPRGTTTYIYKDPSHVVETKSPLGHFDIHASKSRFSIETDPSTGTDRESRRRFSVQRNSAHTAYNTESGLSRHGDYLAAIAERRKPSIRSDQSNVSGSSGRQSKGDEEKARMTDDSKAGHARSRTESKQYKIWLPEEAKQSPTRSRSERVASSGLRHVWREREDGQWIIDEELVQTANVQKRPSV